MIINEKRALAYTAQIAWVRPIEGADNIELVGVNGWTCIAKKGEFKQDDFCIYFEIDSKLPVADWSAFMEKRKYKVKTMKLGKFNVVSQGLALPYSAFSIDLPNEINVDLTDKLKVTYSVEEDNVRKADSTDKYKAMMQRKKKIFRNLIVQRIMKYEVGRKIMFFFFGRKKDKKNSWPAWVKKTDEERVQNMPFLFTNPNRENEKWMATEKIDGTSTTFTMKYHKFKKNEFYICSRNVVFDTADKKCFYDTNVYCEMAEKYDIQDKMRDMLNYWRIQYPDVEYITLQGETYGKDIQKRNYGLNEHRFAAFNFIIGFKNEQKRLNPVQMTKFLELYDIPCVPIVDTALILPETCDEMLKIAGGPSAIDGEMREGLVMRSYSGEKSFKAVDSNYLIKYHQ